MLDVNTCIIKLKTIKSTIGSGDDLFDSIINYLENINPLLSEDCECRHRDNCMFYSTYKHDAKRVDNSASKKNCAFEDSDTEYYKLLIDIGKIMAHDRLLNKYHKLEKRIADEVIKVVKREAMEKITRLERV